MTVARRNRRKIISSKEAEKQHKVVARAEMMVEKYKEMGLEELAKIENGKRSKTDNFAYHAAVYELTHPTDRPAS